MIDSSPKQEPPYGLRMPPDLKARVKLAAEANNRSMNAEIVATLEAAYPAPSLRDFQAMVSKLVSDFEAMPDGPEKSEAWVNLRAFMIEVASSMLVEAREIPPGDDALDKQIAELETRLIALRNRNSSP